MTKDPYLFKKSQKKYRWSYQFGLYRYDSDDRGSRYRNIIMKRSNIQYFAILALFGIAIIMICFLMYTSASKVVIEDLPSHETTLEEYPSNFRSVIDVKHNSSIAKLANSSTISNFAAEKLIQSLPNLYLEPPSITLHTDDLYPMESNKKDDKFQPLYFDEYIPNLQPPPKIKQLITQTRRNYLPPPNPFRFISSGVRPQAFQMHPQNIDRKFPQIYDQYLYPQNVMNIQDIIQYLTNKRSRTLNKIAFTGKFQNINSDYSTQVNRNQDNDNGVPLTKEQFFNDPFYKFKPSDPSDINLLAPNQFRFAPSLLQNHRFIPASEDIPNTRIRKANPVSLMLDIYPMPEANDEVDKYGTRKPIILLPMYNPGNNYNSLNSLYHLSNYPNQQSIIIPKAPTNKMNKNQNLNVYDVTGYHYKNAHRYNQQIQEPYNTKSDLEKMVVHLNLYPKKKFNQHSEFKNNENYVNLEDNLFMESIVHNTTVPISGTVINNITNEIAKINNNSVNSETIKNEINNFNAEGKHIHRKFSASKEFKMQETPSNNENDKDYSLEIQKSSVKESHLTQPIEQNLHIQFIDNTTQVKNYPNYSISIESGFYPIKFNNISFSSQPLDKNYMADIQGHQSKKEFTKESNFETTFNSSEIIQYYEPLLVNSDIDRSDNYTTENENSSDESNLMTELLENFEVNPNLRNHKPFFSVVNDSLKHS